MQVPFLKLYYGRGEIYPPALWRGTCQPQADLNAPKAHKPPQRRALPAGFVAGFDSASNLSSHFRP